ncbi:MAG TPA: hypothetical protein PKL83_01670, partial [bacterium]|nr:hypothetical protein [bacterium]
TASGIVRGDLRSGIYEAGSDGMNYCRPGYMFSQIEKPSEFLLHVSRPGRELTHNIEYAHLQFPCGIITSHAAMRDDIDRIAGFIKKVCLSVES